MISLLAFWYQLAENIKTNVFGARIVIFNSLINFRSIRKNYKFSGSSIIIECALVKKFGVPTVIDQLVLTQFSESALFPAGLLFCPRIMLQTFSCCNRTLETFYLKLGVYISHFINCFFNCNLCFLEEYLKLICGLKYFFLLETFKNLKWVSSVEFKFNKIFW